MGIGRYMCQCRYRSLPSSSPVPLPPPPPPPPPPGPPPLFNLWVCSPASPSPPPPRPPSPPPPPARPLALHRLSMLWYRSLVSPPLRRACLLCTAAPLPLSLTPALRFVSGLSIRFDMCNCTALHCTALLYRVYS